MFSIFRDVRHGNRHGLCIVSAVLLYGEMGMSAYQDGDAFNGRWIAHPSPTIKIVGWLHLKMIDHYFHLNILRINFSIHDDR
ncbi:MAG: hypothetical protein DI535_05265 [Citrobacter freundii]|nr:MAG: hypothetical protein DI535_05265 [Citrobacter freundii]